MARPKAKSEIQICEPASKLRRFAPLRHSLLVHRVATPLDTIVGRKHSQSFASRFRFRSSHHGRSPHGTGCCGYYRLPGLARGGARVPARDVYWLVVSDGHILH